MAAWVTPHAISLLPHTALPCPAQIWFLRRVVAVAAAAAAAEEKKTIFIYILWVLYVVSARDPSKQK